MLIEHVIVYGFAVALVLGFAVREARRKAKNAASDSYIAELRKAKKDRALRAANRVLHG